MRNRKQRIDATVAQKFQYHIARSFNTRNGIIVERGAKTFSERVTYAHCEKDN